MSISTIYVYDSWIRPKDELLELYKARAVNSAENEIIFSDRFRQIFSSSIPTSFIDAASLGRKSVVYIKPLSKVAVMNTPRRFHGSGVVLTADGYIITNYHVVKDLEKVEVTLYDKRSFEGLVIGYDESTDIAIVKINSNNLEYLIFGDSDSLHVGEWVLAVGNPMNLQSTVTAGIVSAKARNINLLASYGIESFIQTDAVINPGSSGGALINTSGQLIGICTAIQSLSGTYEGFSFAIPSNLALKVFKDIREFGVVQRAWLGVDIEDVNADIAAKARIELLRGVFLASVFKSGSAYLGGLRTGDIITSINNINVDGVTEFMEQLARYRPGDVVRIKYIRNSEDHVVDITLYNQLNTTDLVEVTNHSIFKDIGVEIRKMDAFERSLYPKNGLVVVSVDIYGVIGTSKMEPGYIITSINNMDIHSATFFAETLEKLRGNTIILEGYYPRLPGSYPYTFVMPK